MQETKACTFNGPRDAMPEDEALKVVLAHLYAVHSLARPEHADQTQYVS